MIFPAEAGSEKKMALQYIMNCSAQLNSRDPVSSSGESVFEALAGCASLSQERDESGTVKLPLFHWQNRP